MFDEAEIKRLAKVVKELEEIAKAVQVRAALIESVMMGRIATLHNGRKFKIERVECCVFRGECEPMFYGRPLKVDGTLARRGSESATFSTIIHLGPKHE